MASKLSEESALFWFLLFDILWANFKSPHIKSKLMQWRCHLSGDLRGASVLCYCHESEFQYWWWMLQHLLGILVSNLGLWQWDKLMRLYENICIRMNTGGKCLQLFQIFHLVADTLTWKFWWCFIWNKISLVKLFRFLHSFWVTFSPLGIVYFNDTWKKKADEEWAVYQSSLWFIIDTSGWIEEQCLKLNEEILDYNKSKTYVRYSKNTLVNSENEILCNFPLKYLE